MVKLINIAGFKENAPKVTQHPVKDDIIVPAANGYRLGVEETIHKFENLEIEIDIKAIWKCLLDKRYGPVRGYSIDAIKDAEDYAAAIASNASKVLRISGKGEKNV